MYKKGLLIFIMFLALFQLLVACGPSKSPSEVVEEYLTAKSEVEKEESPQPNPEEY